MLSLIPKKYIVALLLFAALGVAVFFWRAEIYRAAKNEYAASIGQKTIETNTQSLKDTNDVRKEEQSLPDSSIDDGLCYLGIMREADGCGSD